MNPMRCKSCGLNIKQGESITLDGLCCACNQARSNPNGCLYCGERPRISGRDYCSECSIEMGTCFGNYADCSECRKCALKKKCRKETEENNDT